MKRLQRYWLLTFSLGAGPAAEAAELLRGPYLQLGTPNSIIVKWRTDEPDASFVFYGEAPDNLEEFTGSIVPTTEHEVQITGLNPATRYFYSVGSMGERLAGGDTNHFFVTHPPVGIAKPTRIWAIGDSGTASAGVYGSHEVRDGYLNFKGTNHTDVWLMLGDNAYYYGYDWEFQTAVFETYPTILRNTILWSTLGNHETYGPDILGRIAYHDIFTLPASAEAGGTASGTENYYSFDYANVHFVCLDSELSERHVGSPMWSWLEQDLQANTNAWIIAFWHSPPYSKGSHDSDRMDDNFGNMTFMRTNFVSLLEAYNVDLVLSGHSHIYERSHLIHGHYGFSASLQPSMIRDGGSGRTNDTGAYIKSDADPGAVYIVAGSSGWATVRTGHHPIMFMDELELGSMVIDVDGSRMDVKFLRETGAIDDYFTILKDASPQPLRIVVFRVHNGQTFVRWRSVAGRTYRVEQNVALQTPQWTPVSPEIVATGASTSWTDPNPALPTAFYRVVEVVP